MPIAADFSVAVNGDIRHTSGSTNYTVIELHRWLGDLMDDAQASGNDLLDITDATASERSTDNIITLKAPYNIDDTAAQFLYDGSIIQKDGDEIYDGILVFAAAGAYLDIVQNGALATNFWTTGLNADATAGISHRFMLKVRTAGADIDGRRVIGQTREFGFSYSEFRIATGTVRGNNVLALTYATDLNNQTAVGTVAGWTTITNTTEGYVLLDVNNDTVNEAYYSEWNKDTYTINQFYERMKWLTRRGTASTIYGLNGDIFRGITHECNISTGSGTWGTPEHEEVTWSGGTGQLIAVDNKTGTATTKLWIQLLTGVAPTDTQVLTGTTSSATATNSGTPTERTLSFPFIGQSTGAAIIGGYGVGLETTDLAATDKVFDLTNTQRTPPNNVTFSVGGLINGEDRVLVGPLGYSFAYDGESGGPFVLGETITFTSPAATGYVSEVNDATPVGRMKIRLLTGTVPTNNSTMSGGGSGATANVNGTVSPSEDPRQLKLATTLSADPETQVVCTSAIPTDTPSSGTIRIQMDTGLYRLINYSSYTGSTFTISGTENFASDPATGGAGETGNSIFISYIDKLAGSDTESFTGVYLADRNLFVRVRDGGTAGDLIPIKTFETTATLGSAGGSSTAIRTTDA